MTAGGMLRRLLLSRTTGHSSAADAGVRRAAGRAGRRLIPRALERLGDPVAVTDPDGRLVYANAAARDLRTDLGV
ncbi:MAG TPA: PAS domain-containing protein, partial [Cryptosporangiaceae bacterium]|nr:PAS domain-containing protein [Cryptosporangiaceae bacterium]